MATDLPEPVVPATSRCGILARSTMTGSPPMVLPSAMASLCLVSAKSGEASEFAQIDGLAARIGQLDADGVAPRHHGDAGGNRRHRARDVVGQPDHPRRFDPRRRLEFVKRHHRAGMGVEHIAAHAEILQRLFQRVGVDLQLFGRLAVVVAMRRLRSACRARRARIRRRARQSFRGSRRPAFWRA